MSRKRKHMKINTRLYSIRKSRNPKRKWPLLHLVTRLNTKSRFEEGLRLGSVVKPPVEQNSQTVAHLECATQIPKLILFEGERGDRTKPTESHDGSQEFDCCNSSDVGSFIRVSELSLPLSYRCQCEITFFVFILLR